MSEVTSKIQLSYLKNGSWTSFGTTAQSSMDGIKIQTASDSPYYLQYRTWNEGKDGYYSYVKSNVNDYAGSSGKPIQRLNIQIYKNDGTKLDSGVVIMYRALVDGAWMPWVSNATSDWMRSVRDKYGLGGTLDEANGFTGVTGKNIQGIELHVFEEGEITSGNQDFSSGEVSVSLSYMSGDASNWHAFERSVIAQMDGLKIQTGADKGYYLQYRTWNEGKDGYYPYVTSNVDDYAGSAGKPIQRLNIQVYKSDGTKLDSGVIVMFRALVDGEWMPWVSNATGAWMQDIQNRYNLGGTLDLSNGYTGKAGVNIQGIEIRVFEEDSFSPGAADFDGKEISLSMAYMRGDASNWIDCRNSVIFDSADGLRIQTDPSLPFYLSYRTQNEGKDDYYSDVSSIDTSAAAYAGSAGKPIQRVGIYALDKNGNKLTTGVVVMYRARVEGVWMPWVSNAAPEWMHSVHSQYDLMGTLDTASGHTGVAGKNIDGFEVRIFTGKSNYHPVENLPGTEYAPSLSYMADSLSNWTSFSQKATADHMDGIRIQTDPSKEYYISYRTKNAGNSSYYSFVSSLDTSSSAYAGSAGKPIQRLGIRVYRRSDGAKLTTGVVVMYRVYANGHWLKWVSNADREWMDSARSKYGLDGGMDYVSGYAGLDGYNIQGVEIRVFEENGMEDTPQTPVGQSKIIDAPHVYQNDPKNKFPSGCESASAVMALQYMGYSVSMTDFVTNYLDKAPRTNFHPNIAFGGDPGQSDYGCYAPVIKNAINKILAPTNYEAKELHDVPIATLCSEYIDNDIPVIFWATTDMDPWYYGATLYYNGTSFKWIAPEHCLLLVGYDDNYYYFNDPQKISAKTRYWKADVEAAYAGLLKQAVVIVEKSFKGALPDEKYLTYEEQLELTAVQSLIAKYCPTPDGLNGVVDIEKISALYDYIQDIRSEHYDEYASNSEDMKFLNALPNRPNYKTTKITLSHKVIFTPETIRGINAGQDIFVKVLESLPIPTARFWALLLTISMEMQDKGKMDLLGFAITAGNEIVDYYVGKLGELGKILGGMLGLLDKAYTLKGFNDALEQEYCIYNGNRLYAGDSYFQFEVRYDLGTEHVVYDVYLRNGIPIIIEEHGPVRVDFPSDGYFNIGYVKNLIKQWKDDGYVLSQYHLERNSSFNEDYGI